MTDKVFQLISNKNKKEKMTAEFRAAVDQLYNETLDTDQDFILISADPTGTGMSFISNLDQSGINLLIDQLKLSVLTGGWTQ